MTGQFLIARIAVIVLLGIGAWTGWRVFRPRRSPLDNAFLFFPLICLCLLATRWPHINWPQELNPDESQLVVEGARILAHPVPWRDVDGTTSGPLNYMALSLPMLFGAPMSWQTARMTLWAMQCLTLIFLYLALRDFGPRAEVQLVLLPTIFFYAFAYHQDFTHYSSETLPTLMLAAGLCLLCGEWNAAESSIPRLFAIGCLAGAIPFAKLQAAPLAAFLILVAFIQAVFKSQREGKLRVNWFRVLGAVCLGGMLVPSLILGLVIASGAFNDFWKSYLLAGAFYTAQESYRIKLLNLFNVVATNPYSDFKEYFASAMTVLVLFLFICRESTSRLGRQFFWLFVVILADGMLTLFCIFLAGKGFNHYTYLLVPPLGVMFGVAFFGTKKLLSLPVQNGPASLGSWKPVILTVCVVVIALQFSKVFDYLKYIRIYAPSQEFLAKSPVSQYALSASQPGDTMSVWGWMPCFYVETGLLPATRDTISQNCISQGPYQDYFRTRYLADLHRNPPAIFIDAYADGMFRWYWAGPETHETFPKLTQFIDQNYSLWLSIRLTNSVKVGSPIRIYLLKERLTAHSLSPAEVMLPVRPSDWSF